METIKVKLVYTEDDSYNELWREVGGKRRYFARHVYGKPIWYHVCDPLGYRELDYPCKNIVFAVCNAYGRALFQDSNLPEYSNPFPTLHQAARYLNMSDSGLTHFLHDRCKTSFKKLLIEKRIAFAEKLWKEDPTLSISEAALRSGYDDPHYFTRIYRKVRHITPGMARKEKPEQK